MNLSYFISLKCITNRQSFASFSKALYRAAFITILSVSSLSSADPFYDYLRSQGRDSYLEEEHLAYAREHVDEYVDLIRPDVEDIANKILTAFDPATHFFIDIGSGPSPIAAYMQNISGVLRANIPLSGFADYVDERGFFVKNRQPGQPYIIPESDYLKILNDHFDRFIPKEALSANKTIVLIDTVQSGTTLLNSHRRISDYVHAINPSQRVEALGLLHPGVKPISERPDLNIESEEQIRQRLKSFHYITLGNTRLGRMLFNRVFKEFSEYTRFEPGREQSNAVQRLDLFQKMQRAMAKRTRPSSSFSCSVMFGKGY